MTQERHPENSPTEASRQTPDRSPIPSREIGLFNWWLEHGGPAWVRYGIAILAVVLALLTDEVDFLTGGFRIYLVFYPFIVLATLFGGAGPGLLATFLSCFAAAFYWMEPIGHFAIASRADMVSMATFIAGNLFFIWLCTRLRQALRLAAEAEAHRTHALEMTHQAEVLKKSERELMRREQILKDAQRMTRLGNWQWDPKTDQTVWSEELYQIFGRDPSLPPPSYREFAGFFMPESSARLNQAVREFLENGTSYQLTLEFTHPDGSPRWVSGSGEALRDDTGKIVQLLGTVQDITERKQAENHLAKSKEAAETANRAKARFIAVLSHELRTPLTPVLATVSAMKDRAELSEEVRGVMTLIHRNIEMEAVLIDDLLDVTRINSGKITMHPEPVNAHACLQAALHTAKNDIAAKGLALTVEPHAARHHVWADPTRLQQVFWNLVRNAVKFTSEGGKISIRSSNTEDRLRIEIADTGIGIPPEVLPRIFDPFEQGEQTTTRFFGGLGLGLSIAKAVVELHNGRLEAFSAGKDTGATFTVDLPTIDASPDRAEPHAAPAQPSRQPFKILLVEDHADTLAVMAKLLTHSGYTVQTAPQVRSALECAARESFDLLISDLGLPDGSGLDLLRELKKTHNHMRGIALSGYGTEEDISHSREAGFERHLTKPVNFEALREAIEHVMARPAR